MCTVDAELSKAEFTDMAEDVAAQLVAAGVTTGEAVALQASAVPAWPPACSARGSPGRCASR